ncbi:nuclear transport factor 2 family protein [Ruegeria sp. 2205SS24-7]|uniref:nuclear transport factor 2 family protein n=1 Tax=Ruegeria discodermiae TaxID=3064389 RepID=UPI002740F1F4|nr:nuclear transport factor 2 family protein [Ruegeria sp. 2205SS24-7]MDP5218753.1 nuclear transport factor 2 family protein [Ruegeria sp. 2205SS24-7]
MNKLPNVIETYINAYNQKDVDGMLACLCNSVEFQNITEGVVSASTTGKQEFRELAQLAVQLFESRRQTVTHIISVADTTLVEIDFTARVAMDTSNGWKAGQELRLSGAAAFRVANGKIVSIIDES